MTDRTQVPDPRPAPSRALLPIARRRTGTLAMTVLLTAVAPATWGTTYVVTTELLPPDRPLLAAVLRVLPVGLAIAVVGRRRPTGVWWWRLGVLGALNIGVFQALLFVAATRLPGGVAATAGAVQPLVVAGLAALALGERFHRRTALAGAAGVLGVAALVLGPEAALDPVGVAAALAGTLAMAAGVVLTKRWGRPVGLLLATGWQLTVGGMLLLPVALLVEGAPPAFDAPALLGVAWLALVGTALAYALWFRGLERLPATAVSFLGLLSPVVATLLGWLLLDQRLTWVQLGGAVLIGGAILAAQRRTAGPTAATETSPPVTGQPAPVPAAVAAVRGLDVNYAADAGSVASPLTDPDRSGGPWSPSRSRSSCSPASSSRAVCSPSTSC